MVIPNIGEKKEDFIKRSLDDPEAVTMYPDKKQREAVIISRYAKHTATPPHPVVEWVSGFETKVEAINKSVNSTGLLVKENTNEIKTVLGRIQRKLDEKIEEKATKDEMGISQIIELINAKEYNPEIKFDGGVLDFMILVLNRLEDIKKEVMKKRTWEHTIVRDSNELIKSVISVSK